MPTEWLKRCAKRWFNRLDHAAIYLFIAGSYMPFTFGVLPADLDG